ncbi:unnamed protein product [Prorocentrum cordatum]|uniref:Exocyst complex component n=1 Tax=Prorocentrum cordatum TaxID=2364126 RepID=A0ABN9VP95_9DINO|nr:unnamed protein product [Polarella glacialis]
MASSSSAGGQQTPPQETLELCLPDLMGALACTEDSVSVAPRRLGSRVQFDASHAILSSMGPAPLEAVRGMDGDDRFVKQENRGENRWEVTSAGQEEMKDGSGTEHAKTKDATEESVTAMLELGGLSLAFYSTAVAMLQSTSVKPPPVPEAAQDMARPVGTEDGDPEQDDVADADGDGDGQGDRPLAVDGGNVDDGENILAFQQTKGINDLSVSGNLPSGTVYGAVNKIRGTINAYVNKLAESSWYDKFVLGTMHALHRRLMKHKHNVVGKAQFDVQCAFHQLDNRLDKGLIALYKGTKGWLESQDDAMLIDTLEPFTIVLPCLMKERVCLSEELRIVMIYAIFQGLAAQLKSVPQAMEIFDVTILEVFCKIRSYTPIVEAAPAVKVEADIEVDSCCVTATATEAQSGSGNAGGQLEARPKRRARRQLEDIHSRVPTGQTPVFYMSCMISESIRAWLSSVPAESAERATDAYKVMQDLELVGKSWDSKESQALRSVVTIAKCMSHYESSRPPTAEVRQARRTIHDLIRQASSPASELARTMQACPVGKAFMEASRKHVAQSIEDDTATTSFDLASKSFQKDFEQAFDDAEGWVAEMRNMSRHTGYTEITTVMTKMHLFFTTAHGSIKAWSTASCRANLKFCAENLNNCLVLLQIGKYMLVDIFDQLIVDQIPILGDALIHQYSDPANDAAQGEAGEDEQSEKQEQEPKTFEEYKAKLKDMIDNFEKRTHLFESTVDQFRGCLSDLDRKWRCSANLLHQLVGDPVFDYIAEEDFNPLKFESNLISISSVLKNMASFMNASCKLVKMRKVDTPSKEVHDNLANEIVQFAGMVSFTQKEGFVFDASSAVTRQEVIDKTVTAFQAFVGGPGPTG